MKVKPWTISQMKNFETIKPKYSANLSFFKCKKLWLLKQKKTYFGLSKLYSSLNNPIDSIIMLRSTLNTSLQLKAIRYIKNISKHQTNELAEKLANMQDA